MISFKVFALSLLLVCPLAFARVQLNARFEVKNSARFGNRVIDTHVLLNENKSKEVYKSDDVQIIAELLDEKEKTATTRYTIYAKNEDGNFEKLMAPVLVPNYGKDAMISLGSSDGETFTITLQAKKV